MSTMQQTLKSLGNNVRKHRQAHNMSQEELADKIGMDARSIVAIESGRRNTTIQTLKRLSKALNVSSAQLLPF